MTISRISANLQQTDKAKIKDLADVARSCFDAQRNFIGFAILEERGQWCFLPVGLEVWYDNESNLFVTKFPESVAIECVSEMREDVGVLLS